MAAVTQQILVYFLVTTFCLNGLTTACVARACRSHLCCYVALTSCLLPLTWVRAYELFWMLFVQQLVVLYGLRRLAASSAGQTMLDNKPDRGRVDSRQLSLTTLFGCVFAIAVPVAVFSKTQAQGAYQWANIVVVGVTIGAVMLSACAVLQRVLGQITVTASVVSVAGLVSLVFFDRLIPVLHGDEDWVASPFNSMPGLGFAWWEFCGSSLWYYVVSAVWGVSLVWQWVLRTPNRPSSRIQRISWLAVGVGIWICLAIPPGSIFCRMMESREPLVGLSGPNEGYEMLMDIGAALENSQMFDGTVLPRSQREAAKEIRRYLPQLEGIEAALNGRCHVVFDWESDPKSFSPQAEELSSIRALQRALRFVARCHRETGDVSAASKYALLHGRVGAELSRGGLWIQYLVSSHGGGSAELVRCLPELSDIEIRRVLNRLVSISDRQEPISVIDQRERAWQRQAYGWAGVFAQVLAEAANDRGDSVVHNLWHRNQCTFQLIALECAIRVFRHENHALPKALEDLVPEYVSETILVDPFAKSGKSFTYRAKLGEYQLYSVGPDQIDDGGVYLKLDKAISFPDFFERRGDFSLTGYRGELQPEDPWLAPSDAADESL